MAFVEASEIGHLVAHLLDHNSVQELNSLYHQADSMLQSLRRFFSGIAACFLSLMLSVSRNAVVSVRAAGGTQLVLKACR